MGIFYKTSVSNTKGRKKHKDNSAFLTSTKIYIVVVVEDAAMDSSGIRRAIHVSVIVL